MTMTKTSEDQARRYRTARFGDSALEMKPNLPKGRVHIEFFNETLNIHYARDEFLFCCWADEKRPTESFLGHWFENALTDFQQ